MNSLLIQSRSPADTMATISGSSTPFSLADDAQAPMLLGRDPGTQPLSAFRRLPPQPRWCSLMDARYRGASPRRGCGEASVAGRLRFSQRIRNQERRLRAEGSLIVQRRPWIQELFSCANESAKCRKRCTRGVEKFPLARQVPFVIFYSAFWLDHWHFSSRTQKEPIAQGGNMHSPSLAIHSNHS